MLSKSKTLYLTKKLKIKLHLKTKKLSKMLAKKHNNGLKAIQMLNMKKLNQKEKLLKKNYNQL